MTPLCAASDVTAEQPMLVRLTPTTSVIVLRLAGNEPVAYRNVCPHMGIELDWDARRLLTHNGRFLQCTGHGALFNPSTGVCVRGPCAGESLIPLPVRIADGMVILDSPSPVGQA
jgi:nitrite reductase/ring-hydroxylating ferredoxin subunit